MSAFNWFTTQDKAFDLRTKSITTSSTVTTYTIRVGGTSDNFEVDRVINVTTTAGNDITITVPDGLYTGQQVSIQFVTDGGTSTITVAATTGSGGDSTMVDAGMYMILEWTNSTTGWVAIKESVTS